MIYKLKLDLLEKIIPSIVTDPEHQKMVMNIVSGRRSHMSFQKACINFDIITGDDISGMVEEYEDAQESKREEAEQFSD
tara:strand:+ start:649 stop:885 length:237 start_codon:yes stop_codon:yes gene_type:complete